MIKDKRRHMNNMTAMKREKNGWEGADLFASRR